jgi:outer membrane protein assembly factor BamB
VAYAPNGQPLWHRDFERFPGALPPWNIGGLTYYFAGCFTDPKRCDVLVSLRRNTMHSDETFLLDGRSGEIIWHRTQGPDIWGCGGGWVAVYDFDQDGLDDVLTWYPHVFFGMHGPSGEILLWQIANKIFDCSAFYANPVVADVLDEGDPQLFFAGSAYVLALMDKEMNARWRSDPASGTPAVTQCLGDIDGDGVLELIGPGYLQTLGETRQEFRAYDAATGTLKWRLPLPGSGFIGNNQGFPDSPTTPAVADLDGDGRDECLFAVVNTLYVVGTTADGKAGEVRWTLEFPERLGTPSIADATGDGTLQILVTCADGYIYGIGADGGEVKR